MSFAARLARADDLSRAFSRALTSPVDTGQDAAYGSVVGVEHEFSVRAADGSEVDFRGLIHSLPLEGRRLDPGDGNSYRCTWGGSITADGREAEIATPPIPVRAGFSGQLVGSAAAGRTVLADALPDDLSLVGYSTHVSVAVPDAIVDRVARLYAERFAAALMLLMDRRTSPGLLVRPRPNRLELCGDYLDGERLEAVAAFAVASVRLTCRAVAGDRAAGRAMPPRVTARVVPAVIRRGWYVDRRAFGVDLYASGRRAWLRQRFGRLTLAQSQLERSWYAARSYADLAPAELQRVDSLVDGRDRLGIEQEAGPSAVPARQAGTVDEIAAGLLASHRRPGFRVRSALATWDFAVFAISGRRRLAYAAVPRRSLGSFFERLDGGHLDRLLLSYLELHARSDRVLQSNEQTRTPGLHDTLGSARQLLPTERPPIGGPVGDRPGKRQDNQPQQSTAQPAAAPSSPPVPAATSFFGLSPAILVAAVGAVAILGISAALVLGGAFNGGPTPSPVAAVTQTPANPSAVATPSAIGASPTGAVASPVAATCPVGPSPAPPSTQGQFASVVVTRGSDTYATDFSGHPMLQLTHQSCQVTGGAAYRQYQWDDVTGAIHLVVKLPEPPTGGTYTTDAGSLGLSFDIQQIGSGPFSGFVADAGVGADPAAGGGNCTSTVTVPTPGAIAGVASCAGLAQGQANLSASFALGGAAIPSVVPLPAVSPGSGRTILQLGQSATRDGRTITPTAIAEASTLCYPGDSPIPNYTPPGCKLGDGSAQLEPPALLIDITYCVAAGSPAVTVADGTYGQIYELADVFIGGETGATGLADGANTAQYGGKVSEHALDGVIDPGTCKTGYLPFQGGVGVPYLQWGDNPLAADATWWALYPGTPVVPPAGACSPSPAEMQSVAESLVPPNSLSTLSLQGMPSTGEIDGWDHTLCQWTIYADGETTFREAETFWDDALATLGSTVTKTSTAPLILDYDFFTPDGSISAVFNELADGSTDTDINIHVTGTPSVPQGAVRLRATS